MFSVLSVPAGVPHGTAAAAAAARGLALLPVLSDGQDGGHHGQGNYAQDDEVPEAHAPNPRARPARWKSRVTTHAVRHCQRTTPTAHFGPISRRMDATAATQGV